MFQRPQLVDYHIHSNHSSDGKSSIFDMCQTAYQLGFSAIGFSEHMDFDPQDWGYGYFHYDKYSSEIKRVQKLFQNRIIIRKGIEIDYQKYFEEEIKEWLKDKQFDFIIGSVHYLNHEYINCELVTKKNIQELYNDYFTEIINSIDCGHFNVIGHLDLLGRYLSNMQNELMKISYWKYIKTILKKIMEADMYLEINTKGLRESYGDINPNRKVLQEYLQNEGRLISIGSDAHSSMEIGFGIKNVLEYLTSYPRYIQLL